jgi:alpha-galactosidase
MSLDDVSRRDFLAQLTALSQSGKLLNGTAPATPSHFENSSLQGFIEGSNECLWGYRVKSSGREFRILPPIFNIDGDRVGAALAGVDRVGEPQRLRSGVTEYIYRGVFALHPDLALTLQFRVGDESPIVRFRYTLESKGQHKLTKLRGVDDIYYLAVFFAGLPQLTEVRLSNFSELSHSYCLEEVALEPRDYAAPLQSMGPILVATDGQHSALIAYEHGSQVPEAFLEFLVGHDRGIILSGTKGNYLSDQVVSPAHNYETVWFEFGAINGSQDQLASAFRSFVQNDMSQSLASRKPYICYNTWNLQERDRWLNRKSYLDSMNSARLLGEVDAAHRMGIEVYVLDAGWYGLTGDWNVNLERFPDGLKGVRGRLDQYGMKLGLWFGATTADARSAAYQNYKDCVMSWKGVERTPSPGFASDVNYLMCLVSRYGDAFLEQLIRVHRETGMTYFKWDGIEQNVCDSPHHEHGTMAHSILERANSHAFQLVRRMGSIADRLVESCPDAIIDFDITERHRAVGLSFLSSGRYFLINNGPYYHSYDIPEDKGNVNGNLLFYPGPARTWVCRAPLPLDRWIPSNLLLTHYYPDDPLESQEVNLASLVLGQNGIWGDLLGVSEGGARYIAETLAHYKLVREAVAESDSVITGLVSGSPEIHEKISARSGKGVVAIFATAPGRYTYATRNQAAKPVWTGDLAEAYVDSSGVGRITANFAKPGAKIIFFGVE